MDIIRLVLAILACYRLSQVVSQDNGPFFIFRRLRDYTDNKRYQEQALGNSELWETLDDLITCPYCQGLYWGLLCALVIAYPTFWTDGLLIWFGIAGGQAFLQGQTK